MICAHVSANAAGNGVRYSIRCNDEKSLLDKPLSKGRYRGHCPISGTSYLLEVERNAPSYKVHRIWKVWKVIIKYRVS
jgi:hypothetical protein